MSSYAEFIDTKSHLGGAYGFRPVWTPEFLFDFQGALVTWAVEKGRAALLADCGLGKTPMQLVWAENVRRFTGQPVLILTPLAVGAQTVQEAAKFGIEAGISRDGSAVARITVTNYEQLGKFDPKDFAGVVCDESSAIKAFDGERRAAVTAFMRKMRFRLLCTATAAPNDYTELGTSSEALGEMGLMDMLGRFFKNDQNNCSTRAAYRTNGGEGSMKWRFKGHAEQHFWRWVCSWARALRRPSDLGFADDRFVLPPLEQVEHRVTARTRAPGMLFDMPAVGLREEREEARRTIRERCEKVAELVAHDQPAVAWCHLNAEGDLLAKMIPDAVQVSGSDSPEAKEEAFTAFGTGKVRVLVIKPKCGAWGLNWQHCAHMTFFPSHSFEQYYQAVRRSWRFGQTRPVRVDVVSTDGGLEVLHNLQRKADQADRMFSSLVSHMNNALRIDRASIGDRAVMLPAWMEAAPCQS